jgi:uncharacterized membrane protein YphA (DoxX/SURF4 family)
MRIEKGVLLALVALGALPMLGLGLAKASGAEMFVKNMAALHYSEAFTRFIGLCEIAGAAGLVYGRTRILAALGLLMIMTGAIGSHISAGHPFASASGAIGFAVLFTLIAAIDWHFNQRAATAETRQPREQLRAAA